MRYSQVALINFLTYAFIYIASVQLSRILIFSRLDLTHRLDHIKLPFKKMANYWQFPIAQTIFSIRNETIFHVTYLFVKLETCFCMTMILEKFLYFKRL